MYEEYLLSHVLRATVLPKHCRTKNVIPINFDPVAEECRVPVVTDNLNEYLCTSATS